MPDVTDDPTHPKRLGPDAYNATGRLKSSACRSSS